MNRQRHFVPRILFLCALALMASSCVGIQSDIEIRADGSGTIGLEYRLSRLVEAMGKLDGNENLLPLPVGRADLERTVGRVQGLTLTSFASAQDENDITVTASFAFTGLETLKSFLDATGRAATIAAADGNRVLTLRFAEGGGPLDPDLQKLLETVFAGYGLDLGVSLPTTPTVAFTDANGKKIAAPVGSAVVNQRTVRYTAAIADLLNAKDPIALTVSWKE